MDFQDKQKYQEIYPVKLATDISTATLAIYLFWQHTLISGIIVAIVPSVIVTIVIIKWVPHEVYRHSVLGRYVDRYMTSAMRLLRLGGTYYYGDSSIVPCRGAYLAWSRCNSFGWLCRILFLVTASSAQQLVTQFFFRIEVLTRCSSQK